MSTRYAFGAAVLCLAASTAFAADVVKTKQSSVAGHVTQMSAVEVTVEQGAITKRIAVNEIEWIRYEEEPASMTTARTAIEAGRFEDAQTTLEKVNVAEIDRAEVKQDVEFYKALVASRLALAGNTNIKEAGKLMAAFVRTNTGNYHYLQGCEMVGDLLVAVGNFAAAQQYYEQLGKAPWADYKMRANVAIGRSLLAEGKAAEAAKAFQAILDSDSKGELAEQQKLAATLGKARCLAEAKQIDEAIKLAEGIIAKADPEAVDVNAQAYNTLGVAYRKAGKPKDAVLAFLHTDTLYYAVPVYHIEALENLVQLWNELQKPERAAEATRTLTERYNRTSN
jgi:tetratricopeptide (TPR) repeat protein